ncbi:Putative cell wall binding repeat-containing protein [Lachnospiraceae bacterium NE2001]|nr:Putative cell wall binding repeat-containing protein [Lachnospiraceae bacterium NE2001]
MLTLQGRVKRRLAVLMALAVLMSAIAFYPLKSDAVSGSWKANSVGWWFEYSNGSCPRGQWLEISGGWYYYKDDGYMDSCGYRDGYWLSGSGAWDPAYSGGHWCCNSVGWWYEDSGWYPTSQWLQINGSWYYFKADGYMATNQWIDGCYLGESGAWIPDYTEGSGSGSSGSGSSESEAESASKPNATSDSKENYDESPAYWHWLADQVSHSYEKVATIDEIDFARAYSSVNDRTEYDWYYSDEDDLGIIHYYLYVSKDVDIKNIYIKYNGDDGFLDIGDGYKQYIPNCSDTKVTAYAELCTDDYQLGIANDAPTSRKRYEYMSGQGYNKYIDLEIQYIAQGAVTLDVCYKDTKLTTISLSSNVTTNSHNISLSEKSVYDEVIKYKSNMTDRELVEASKYWYMQQDYNAGYTCFCCHKVADIMKLRGRSSICLSCCYLRNNKAVNDYNSYYAVSSNRKVNNGDEYDLGHRICLVFLDSTHYAYVEVQGYGDHFEKAWEPSECKIYSIYDSFEELRDYETVYDMVKGDYGIDLKTFDPMDSTTWY